MTTTSLDYLLNPIYNTIDFAIGEDFMKNGKRNIAYFVINLFIGLIISFISLVFNEFLILFFWDLYQDTHIEISRRSTLDEDTINLEEIEDDDDDGET